MPQVRGFNRTSELYIHFMDEERSNKEVLKGREYIQTSYTNKTNTSTAACFHGARVERRHGLENLAVTERIDGRKARGRQRQKYLDSLWESWSAQQSSSGLQRTDCSGSAWSRTSSTTPRQHDMAWGDVSKASAASEMNQIRLIKSANRSKTA